MQRLAQPVATRTEAIGGSGLGEGEGEDEATAPTSAASTTAGVMTHSTEHFHKSLGTNGRHFV